MAMIRCTHGHFYDAAKHTSCPYCGVGADAVEGKNAARSRSCERRRARAGRSGSIGGSGGVGGSRLTRAVFRDVSSGISPVVGWLVRVGGPDKGRDFRIHGEKNFIGSSPSMDIALTSDDSVSRDKHASVAYDPRQPAF
jgi:hypothetical protein